MTWNVSGDYGMEVSRYDNGTFTGSETVTGNIYTHRNVDTNVEYTYVFKLSDGTNVSLGTIKKYTREGASGMTGITMTQIEKTGGYDAKIEWNLNESAESIALTATNGSRTVKENLAGDATAYTIPNVVFGDEWTVTLVAKNSKGASLPASASLKIGKTAIGFSASILRRRPPVADGDDDEASAWLWLHEEYPSASYVYFGDITSASDLERFRVLFWMRDLEGVTENEVFSMPQVVEDATPYVREWYAEGGNLLLWSHATVYVGALAVWRWICLKTTTIR